MERHLLCPRTELCNVYRIYEEISKDNRIGIIEVSTIEGRDFYDCKALNMVMELLKKGKLAKEAADRLEGLFDCFLIDQANKAVEKRRSEF